MSALSFPLDVTVFRDLAAGTAENKRITLNDLAAMAEARQGATKRDLPLIKLGLFGTRRTPKGSLRHRANMDGVSGVEGDYDGGTLSIEAAADALRVAGLAAVLYTSPSHTPAAPRWRVLCPLSQLADVSARRGYLGQLNAVLGGVLAGESFTDAQSFYIGSTDAAPVTVIRLQGEFVDRAKLPAPMFPRRQDAADIVLPPMRQDQAAAEHLAQAVGAVREAFTRRGDIGRHQMILPTTNILAPFVLSGHMSRDEAEQHVAEAMQADGRVPNDDEISDALAGALRTVRPYYVPTGGTEFGQLPPLPAPARKRLFTSRDFRIDAHQGYVVKGLLSPGNVGVLLGHPGAGKSTLAPYLAYAVAQGRPFFGLRTRAGRTLIAAAEDLNGVQKRVAALGMRFGHTEDCAVVEVGTLRDAAERASLADTVADFRPVLVVLDTVAAAFAGMEENSSQDMGEVVALARRLAATGAAVVLVHHPAKAGDGTPRGHGSLNGTLDVVLTLAPDDVTDASTVVRGETPKNRNGTTAWNLAFRKEVITLGTDVEGDPITTTLPVAVDQAAERSAAPSKLSPQEAAAMTLARQRFGGGGHFTEDEWIDALASFSTAGKPQDRARSARRIHAGLVAKGAVCIAGGSVRPSEVRTNAGPLQGTEFT